VANSKNENIEVHQRLIDHVFVDMVEIERHLFVDKNDTMSLRAKKKSEKVH